jgi:tripartite-type tricarboxylate transporter receptor subunit TctC
MPLVFQRAASRSSSPIRPAAASTQWPAWCAELRKLGNDPEVQKRIQLEGGDPLISTPAEYADDIDREEKKWSKLVHRLGLKVE